MCAVVDLQIENRRPRRFEEWLSEGLPVFANDDFVAKKNLGIWIQVHEADKFKQCVGIKAVVMIEKGTPVATGQTQAFVRRRADMLVCVVGGVLDPVGVGGDEFFDHCVQSRITGCIINNADFPVGIGLQCDAGQSLFQITRGNFINWQ